MAKNSGINFLVSKTSQAAKKEIGFLEGIRVSNLKGERVLVSDLWKENTVILKVLRRFGCPLCRYEARILSELKHEFDSLDVKLYAVGFEEVGLKEFMAGEYWSFGILIDTERSIHTALALQKVEVTAGLKDVFSTSTRSAITASRNAGISGDLRGDGFQLGGTFILEKITGKVLYEFNQTSAGSYSSLKEIYQACGGKPDNISEAAPKACINYTKSSCLPGDQCS